MKTRNNNKYRSQKGEDNVRLLESALPLLERLFGPTARRRAFRALRRWFLILLLAAPVVAGILWGINYAVEKAYSMSIDNISYESGQKLITKEQVLELLGIKGSINMATLNATGMQKKLESNPCIESAHIRAEFPDTLCIEVEERVPVVYVEMEHAADTGRRSRLFMAPDGTLFPVVESYHRNFLGLPVWYLRPGDVQDFRVGAVVEEKVRRPIVDLVTVANMYSLVEIPAIREIFRPKEWKILMTLDSGTEVEMQVYNIKGQMERLAMILEHARATNRKASAVNVIPRINPTVQYAGESGK